MSQQAPPITYLMFVFNEEGRIRDVLRHAVQWADEVLVLDKQSTDRTRAICAEFSPHVRVIEIPFTAQGHDDMVSAAKLATHDWIWLGTASEIPTRKVVSEARRILAEQPALELVYVPRKVYSFGIYSPDTPWGVPSYPFLFHRERAIISNTIHHNFHPRTKANTAAIPFSEDCCVHHFTHANARSYMNALVQYFEAESARPELNELIEQSLEALDNRPDLRKIRGKDAFGLECGWRIYSLGVALFAWDKLRGIDAPQVYREERQKLLAREWPGQPNQSVVASRQPPLPEPQIITKDHLVGLDRISEDQILHMLRGRPICKLVRTLYQVGAHRFQEKDLLFEIFPNLERVILFEPLPEMFAFLQAQEKGDARITVLPYAVSDRDGETSFNVANNDGASSSLLPFAKHNHLFPDVATTKQIPVQTRRLASAMAEHKLPPPDCLFLDVQGAEHLILASLDAALLNRMRMIYTEASAEEIYAGAKTLDDLKALLTEQFYFAGFSPLTQDVEVHGNALFVQRSHAWLLPPQDAPAVIPDQQDNVADKTWARALRNVLSRKMRRSLRKRLATLNRALSN